MEAQATAKYIRSTPRKGRLVVDAVRGMKVGEALSLLELSIRRAVSRDIAKVIKSAVANLQNRHADMHIDVDDVRIKDIIIKQGPTLKRFRPRAQGRTYGILKRMCHITVTVSD